MGFFSGLRRKIKKIIPKEVRPFIPYAAAMIPGLQGLGGLGPVSSRFLTAAAARGLTDDEASIKDIARAGIFAAAPKYLDTKIQGLDKKSKLGEFLKTAGDAEGATSIAQKVSDFADPKGFKQVATTLGATGGIDAGIKAAELNKDALEKYNADLAAQGIGDRKARRAAIRGIYEGTGTWDMDEVDDMLDTYGYRTGGRVGYEDGGSVITLMDGTTVQIPEGSYTSSGSLKDRIYSSSRGDLLREEIIRELSFAKGGRVGYEDGDAVDSDVDRILKRRKKKTTSMEDLIKDTILDKDNDNDLEENIEMALDGYNRLYPEVKPASIRPLTFAKGGGVMDAIDVNMMEQIDTPRGDMMIDENMEVADSSLMDAYEIYRFDMMEQGLEPMSIEEFRDQAMVEGQMASGDMDVPIQDLADEFEITFGRPANSLDELKDYYKQKYEFNGDVSMMEESERTMAAEGGLMNLGGKEMDLRGGGFVPMGRAERADDVPARLSKNEFVMTADAVRAAGGGSVQKGADLMYDQMKQLEAKA